MNWKLGLRNWRAGKPEAELLSGPQMTHAPETNTKQSRAPVPPTESAAWLSAFDLAKDRCSHSGRELPSRAKTASTSRLWLDGTV
jgi:hypothetical protein